MSICQRKNHSRTTGSKTLCKIMITNNELLPTTIPAETSVYRLPLSRVVFRTEKMTRLYDIAHWAHAFIFNCESIVVPVSVMSLVRILCATSDWVPCPYVTLMCVIRMVYGSGALVISISPLMIDRLAASGLFSSILKCWSQGHFEMEVISDMLFRLYYISGWLWRFICNEELRDLCAGLRFCCISSLISFYPKNLFFEEIRYCPYIFSSILMLYLTICYGETCDIRLMCIVHMKGLETSYVKDTL